MFGQALAFIAHRLDEAKYQGLLTEYALIGEFAVSAWGIPRAAHGVEFALALGAASPTAFSQYLNAEFHVGDQDDPLRGVYQLEYSTNDLNIPIQLSLLPSQWTRIIVDNAVELSILEFTIPVISWQVLILLKLHDGGPQDLLDAQQIFRARQPIQEDLDTIAKLAAQVNLSATWQKFAEHLSP
ncbi:hypothetical protein [Candidatus Nitrospira salsa]